MGWGPEGEIFVTDNQGGWLPASKLIEIKPGEFYNHYTTEKDGTPGRFDDQPVTKPVLWMPQNEIANSPSTPVVVEEGPYAGQMFIGDVTYGGLQRADLEKVDGRYQGALFRMTQGLEAGVSRVLKGSRRLADRRWPRRRRQLGPDRQAPLRPAEARPQRRRALRHGVDGRHRGWLRDHLHPAALGRDPRGPRVEVPGSTSGATGPRPSTAAPSSTRKTLQVTSATASEDGRTVTLQVDGMKPDRVVHLRSPRPFASASDETLWSTEAWYTLNSYPGYVETDPEPAPDGIYELEDGELSGTAGIDDRARRLHRVGLRRRHPVRRLGHHGRGGGTQGRHLRPADPLRQRPEPAAEPDQEDEPLHR